MSVILSLLISSLARTSFLVFCLFLFLFLTDCHCSDWSFKTYFIHRQNSAQSFRLFVRVTPPPPPPPYCSLFDKHRLLFSFPILFICARLQYWQNLLKSMGRSLQVQIVIYQSILSLESSMVHKTTDICTPSKFAKIHRGCFQIFFKT